MDIRSSVPDLSVVVVSFNTRHLLETCLRSLGVGCQGPPARDSNDILQLTVDVIVVDNASSDDSVEMVQREFPWVTLEENDVNRGFAVATNQGLMRARGRHVVLLNPDTETRPAALYHLVRFLDDHPTVGAVGPTLRNPDGSFQHGCFKFPSLAMSFLDFFPINHRLSNSRLNGRYPLRLYRGDVPFPIDHPLGACLMARREVVNEVGLLDEHFFMYCEEVDWCIRIKRAGWEIYCDPRAEVVHYGGQSTSPRWDSMFVELHRSRYRLFEKHYSPFFVAASRLIVRAGVLVEMSRLRWRLLRGLESASAGKRRLAAYRQVLAL